MAEDRYYIGTDLKFKIDIRAAGFNQAEDDYELDLYTGGAEPLHFTQDDIRQDGSDFYLCVPTASLTPGPLKLVVTAHVPDTDFGDNERTEIAVKNVGYLKAV